MFELPKRFGFDLANAFAGDRELLADFFESMVGIHINSKSVGISSDLSDLVDA